MFNRPPSIGPYSASKILVLACIDPRFTEITAWFLTHVKQVHSSYNLFSLAGASLGVVQAANPDSDPDWPVHANWDQVFFDHVVLSVILHGINEIWIFDHLRCGAYEQFLLGPGIEDTESAPHLTQMNKLVTLVEGYTNLDAEMQTRVRNLNVTGFLIHLNGKIEVLLGSPIINMEAYEKSTSYIAAVGLAVLITALFVFAIRK